MNSRVHRGCTVGVLCAAATAFAVFSVFSAAFIGGPPPPLKSSPLSRPPQIATKESTKWQMRKDVLMGELREIDMKLALAVERERRTEVFDDEEYDPELIRLRNRYNIKDDQRSHSPRPATVSAGHGVAPQPLREGRGLVATAAILREAAGEIDWKCDEECLNTLASESSLSSRQVAEMDHKLQEDTNSVQRTLRELEYANRLQPSSETSRCIARLQKFLKVIPGLRRKVAVVSA